MGSQSSDKVISPRRIDFDGFPVRRLLPHHGLRGVGPWVFFDHMGPFDFPAGQGVGVIPHPHINLATVTYLFEGRITHRDSLGNRQDITPGAVNLMVAGRGIAHSERTPDDLRSSGHRVHGLQLWLALPEDSEESEPSFHHYDARSIPERNDDGLAVRVLMGRAFGLESPVRTFAPTLYLDVLIPAGRIWNLPVEFSERGLYGIDGELLIDGTPFPKESFMVLPPGARDVKAASDSHLVLIGGESPGDRYIWWNFVSSSGERIERARSDWKNGRFPVVPGDTDERALMPDTDSHARMLR